MIARILTRLADRLIARAKRTPYWHLEGYMRRWWLFPYGSLPFGIAVRVHEILRSDQDRHPHDHPWPFITVILRGGYWEVRPDVIEVLDGVWVRQGPDRRRWHGPGSVLIRRAKDWHRLELPPDTVATTLFISGPWSQPWGFLVDGEKVYHRNYLPADQWAAESSETYRDLVGGRRA